jgi:hypothetical protein
MKISSSFFAGILWTAMLAPSIAAFAQTQNDQAALAKQSSIVFSGTVSRLGATSFAGVPQSPNTITEGWIFGSGVAVKELGHELNPGGGTLASGADAAESALVQAQKQISDQDLQNRIASSELVVIGRVTDVHRWTIPKSAASRYHTSEHSADWHEAILQIDSVLKGTKPKKSKMVVRFPLSRDVAWVNSPKFEKLQRGIFFLKKDQVSGDPRTSLGGYQVDVYTCLKPGDWLPLSDEARVRSLLKN